MNAIEIQEILMEVNSTFNGSKVISCATEKEAKKLFHKLKYEQKKLNKKLKWHNPKNSSPK